MTNVRVQVGSAKPDWGRAVIRRIRSKRGGGLVAQISPVFVGVRASDLGTDSWADNALAVELLLTLLFRRMIFSKDTNLFNLMTQGSQILSVDENRIEDSMLRSKGLQGCAKGTRLTEENLIAWLTTAQSMGKVAMQQVLAAAKDQRGNQAAHGMLCRFRIAYERGGLRKDLHGDGSGYGEPARDIIAEVHRQAYELWEVPSCDEILRGAENHVTDVGQEHAQWNAAVSAFLAEDGSLAAGRIVMDENAEGKGFKNLSVVTRLRGDDGTEQSVFLKAGETLADSLFHHHAARLRSMLGLTSVPVVVAAITNPDGLQDDDIRRAMDRGQQKHAEQKARKGGPAKVR